jgi:enoyl-CoA hydratase/carnithine racemase
MSAAPGQAPEPQEALVAIEGRTLVVRFNRPQVRNALSDAMLAQAWRAMRDALPDPQVQCVVLTGDEKAFCSGGDLKASAGSTLAPFQRYLSRFAHSQWHDFVRQLARYPKPVIAAIEGHCLGGGLEIALLCDFCIGSESARLGLTEARHGLVPILGGAWSLARCVGPRKAKELLFTGRRVDAQEALALGLLNQVVAPGQALPRALEIATEIAESAPLSVLAMKQAVDRAVDQNLDQALATANEWSSLLGFSDDRREGLEAFRDKRKPRFRGH